MSDDRPILALEVSPLGERNYTGIANVTRMLALQLLKDEDVDARFVMGRCDVPASIMRDVLAMNGGDILWWLSGRLVREMDVSGGLERPVIGLYPSTKAHRRLCPFEVLILHDLTTLITPQYHTPGTVAFWQDQLLPDILSSDLLVAVSQSTAADVRTYFAQAADIPLIVAPLAACGGEVVPLADSVAPFVLVLGTLEPRKNVEVVLDMLSRHPDLLEAAQFVFVGRWGWGADASDLIGSYNLGEAVRRGRIVLTGFVSDAARDQLLAAAVTVIYPSLYEGFGLPLLESMIYGTPVITTLSSSLPEVGGERATYFDYRSAASLHDAVRAALARHGTPGEARSRADRQAWARSFTWTAFYRTIKDGALALERHGRSVSATPDSGRRPAGAV